MKTRDMIKKARELADIHIGQYEAQGTEASIIKGYIEANEWELVGTTYGMLLEEFGKRRRYTQDEYTKQPDLKGKFTANTPADTYNTQVQQVSSALPCGKLKPTKIETDEGTRWGLASPTTSKTKTVKSKSLDKIRKQHADIMQDRTYEEKVSELQAFAKLLGLEIERAPVVEFKPEPVKKTRSRKTKKAA